MPQWGVDSGTSTDIYVNVYENWNSSTQVSMHVRCFVHKHSTGGAVWSDGASWNTNFGGVTASWTGSYNLPAGANEQTWNEFDYTYTKDANGYINIGCYFYANGNNSPYFYAAAVNQSYSPARIPLAPSISSATVTARTATTATLNMNISNYGLGTSATSLMYYKKTTDGSYTATGTTTGTGAKAWAITGLQPNKQYDFLARSTNNNGDQRNLPASYPNASHRFYTLPRAATIGTITPLATTATVPYTQLTDGGVYTITTQYRVKPTAGAYGAWATATGGNIDLTGLLPNTDYTIQTQSITSAGTTTGTEYAFTTLPAGKLIYSDGDVVNAIPRAVVDGDPTVMVNVNIIEPA